MTRTTSFLLGTGLAMMLGLQGAPAWAEDRDINPPPSAEELKGACDAAGGKFVSQGSFYGCKTQCSPEGPCAVLCDDGKCIGTTPDRRQQATGPNVSADILAGRLSVRDDGQSGGRDGHDGPGFPWGAVGLLGLLGLLGMKRDRGPVSGGVDR